MALVDSAGAALDGSGPARSRHDHRRPGRARRRHAPATTRRRSSAPPRSRRWRRSARRSTSTLDLQEVLEAIADSAMTLTGAQRAVVFELDQAAGHLLRARGPRHRPGARATRCPWARARRGPRRRSRAPVWSAGRGGRAAARLRRAGRRRGMSLAELGHATSASAAVLAVPVVSRDAALGAVCIYWDEVHEPDEREIRLLQRARAAGRHRASTMRAWSATCGARSTTSGRAGHARARRHPARGGRAGRGRRAPPQQPHGGGARAAPSCS